MAPAGRVSKSGARKIESHIFLSSMAVWRAPTSRFCALLILLHSSVAGAFLSQATVTGLLTVPRGVSQTWRNHPRSSRRCTERMAFVFPGGDVSSEQRLDPLQIELKRRRLDLRRKQLPTILDDSWLGHDCKAKWMFNSFSSLLSQERTNSLLQRLAVEAARVTDTRVPAERATSVLFAARMFSLSVLLLLAAQIIWLCVVLS